VDIFPLDDLSIGQRDAKMTNSLDIQAAWLPDCPFAGLHCIVFPVYL